MNRYPPQPLTEEERELAQLIARVAPQGEPAGTLDAHILAAAHAAVNSTPQRAPKPRWQVGLGMAASVVFAVGIAWQLRPSQPIAPRASEIPATAAAETAAQTEAEPAADSVTPLPVDDLPVDVVAQDSAAAEVIASAPPPPPPPAEKALPPHAVPVPPPALPTPARVARSRLPEAAPAQSQVQDRDRYRPYDAPPLAVSSAPVMAAPAPATEAPSAFAAEPRENDGSEGLSANQAANYSAARKAAAKQGAAREEMKTGAAIREQERSVQESDTRDRATLDRVEVTGSRLLHTDRQVPISDDARLPVDEWLERVRTRYGLGDAEAAKRSLLLFVREHPSETVPGDLEPLLEK
ncbi:MAG: hypothetical protein ABIP44_11115 [Pseudoxanthomonas sp.]